MEPVRRKPGRPKRTTPRKELTLKDTVIGPRGRSNPPYAPDEIGRNYVKSMTRYGIPQQEICAVLGITLPTLHKYYRYEIDTAMALANMAVGDSIFNAATQEGSMQAAIFWMRTRGGWKEATDPSVSVAVNTGGENPPVLVIKAYESQKPILDMALEPEDDEELYKRK